jgi:Cytochrome c7 and related cytochrome c/Cytochrome c554 and c-prime
VTRVITLAGCALISVFGLAALAQAQQSRCADCHFANPDAPAQDHLSDWDSSAHGRNNVGCERCHGGDATTFEELPAHRDILHSTNPASPVHRQNLPRTCGVCHAGPFTAFQDSQHFALLGKGDARVPVCTTCHGDVGFNRPSAKTLETQCARCHGPRGVAPRVERAEAARTIYEALRESRELLKATRPLINRVSDKSRRAQLDEAYQQAEVPLIQATQAGHRFVYDMLKERLNVARQRIEALFAEIANPNPQATTR